MKSMTTSAWIHDIVRGSKPVRAGASASPECGPDPVTMVPRASTRKPTAYVTQARRAVMVGTSSVREPGSTSLPSCAPRSIAVAMATRTIVARKWNATITGLRPVQTVMPPTTASTKIPTIMAMPRRCSMRRFGNAVHTAHRASTAMTISTPVSVRLPNSMNLWNPSSCAATGVSDPCAQVGQSGHPSPLPVSRTMPPVTMMRTSATTLATRMGRSQDGLQTGRATGDSVCRPSAPHVSGSGGGPPTTVVGWAISMMTGGPRPGPSLRWLQPRLPAANWQC